jgi:hypothetical protein
MIAASSREMATTILKREIKLLPYARPGVELKELVSTYADSQDSHTFLLTNHGTLFQAETVEQLAELVWSFESFAATQLEPTKLFSLDEVSLIYELSEHLVKHVRWHAEHNWRISPDHVVFLGNHAPDGFIKRLLAGVTIRDLLDSAPSVLGSIGLAQEQLLWFLNVSLSLPLKRLTTLSEPEARFLKSWEAEKYRLSNHAR